MFSLLSSSTTSSSTPTPVALTGEALKAAKAALAAVPAGLPMFGRSGKSRGKGKKKDGSKKLTVSKSYNPVGERPCPAITSLERGITVQMRSDVVTQFTSSNVATVYSAFAFTLSSFAQYTEYTGLFDQYRFEQIEVWIEPQTSQSTAVANTGLLTTAVDLDDATVPTSFATVETKQGSLSTNGYAGHYHRWRPHMAVAAYSGVFTSFANVPATWIDAASPNVQHYGIKTAMLATSVATVYSMNFRAKVSFRASGL